MADFTTNKVTGSQLTAVEWNQMVDVDNFTLSSDQTPATGDLNQIGKGVAAYVGQAGIYTTDSGVADAYVVTQVSPFKAPHKLFAGLTIRFRTSNTNTGACTVNAFTLGVKNIKLEDGSTDPAAGDISTDKEIYLTYDGTVWRITGRVIPATSAEINTGTNNTKMITPAALAGSTGKILQIVETSASNFGSGTGVWNYDNTIPQNTEGNTYSSLDTAITPKSSASSLYIEYVTYLGDDSSGNVGAGIWKDSDADALDFSNESCAASGQVVTVKGFFKVASSSTSARTYKLRYGSNSGTTGINGTSSGALFGGAMKSKIRIYEIEN